MLFVWEPALTSSFNLVSFIVHSRRIELVITQTASFFTIYESLRARSLLFRNHAMVRGAGINSKSTRVAKRYVCPAIYGCRCGGRPRARSTVLLHKRKAEQRLRIEDPTVVVLLPPATEYNLIATATGSRTASQSDTDPPCHSLSTDASCHPQRNAHDISRARSSVDSSRLSSACQTARKLSQLEPSLQNKTEEDAFFENGLPDVSGALFDTPFTSSEPVYEDMCLSNDRNGSEVEVAASSQNSGDEAINAGNRYSYPLLSDGSTGETSSALQSNGGSENSLFAAEYCFSKISSFLESHSDLIEFWLRHKVSATAMDDLLRMRKAPITTWKGVTSALYDASDVSISIHPMCSEVHMALPVSGDGRALKCQYRNCVSPVSQFAYISVWERLQARLQSPVYGPELFEYHHSMLNALESGEERSDFRDFHCGNVFKDCVERLGGVEAVRNDIFLFVTGDGAQPYNSSLYDYWPIVAIIGNLSPSKRVNTRNLLPLACIPGPNEPRDLVSFLIPLIRELELLSKGLVCKLWDGSAVKVRVHLLFLLADLPAMAKLCLLKGSNGYSPCRFCLLSGELAGRNGTMYYPSYVIVNGDIERKCELDNLPLRTESETTGTIQEIEKFRQSTSRGSVGMMKDLCLRSGINGQSALFHRLRTLIPYRSCPIDIMHLLLLNIPGNMVDLLYAEGILDSQAERTIDETLQTFGDGVISETRRPRKLKYRKMYKAAEWRFFILQCSLIVFHDTLPSDILDGWYLFVQIVELSFRTYLSDEDVATLGTLAVSFYKFAEDTFYNGNPDNAGVCKYTLHLILHLEGCVRSCGPLANLSQFPMERFVGEVKHGLKAKHLAAESVVEQWRLLESYKNFVVTNSVNSSSYGGIAFKQKHYSPRSSLCSRSETADYASIVFCHPHRSSTVADCEANEPGLRSRLEGFYQRRLGLTAEAAQNLIDENSRIELWDRMAFAESFEDESRVVHFGIEKKNYTEGARRNCYIAAEFVPDGGASSSSSDSSHSELNRLVYYGKVRQFIAHDVTSSDGRSSTRHMLVLVDWLVRGLQKGGQGQLFASLKRDDERLFSDQGLEGADVICRHISVVEKTISTQRRKKHRTYFADSNVFRDRLLEPFSSKTLQGIS